MFTIWPSIVWTSVAQPTEQNGHTLGVTLAFAIRNSCAFATTAVRLTPDAISPPSAVPLPPAIERRKTSRREGSNQGPLSRRLDACAHEKPRPILAESIPMAFRYRFLQKNDFDVCRMGLYQEPQLSTEEGLLRPAIRPNRRRRCSRRAFPLYAVYCSRARAVRRVQSHPTIDLC